MILHSANLLQIGGHVLQLNNLSDVTKKHLKLETRSTAHEDGILPRISPHSLSIYGVGTKRGVGTKLSLISIIFFFT